MKMNTSQKQRALRSAILSLCNVLYSVSFEADSYLSKDEKRTLAVLAGNIEKVLHSVKKDMNKRMIEELERRTDLDYRMWVETHLVDPKFIDLFQAEFSDLIKKYSL